MGSFQDKAIKYLTNKVKEKFPEIDVDMEKSFNNTGTIYFRKNGFETIGIFHFNFQSSYAEGSFEGSHSNKLSGWKWYVDYSQTEKFPDIVEKILNGLTKEA